MKNAYQAGYREGYDNALAEQPFNRAAVIEECARVADHYSEWDAVPTHPADIAAAIRSLKDK